MKMRWRTIASNVSIRTISLTATPLPKAYDCVAVYIAGRHTNLVVYGCRPKPATKKEVPIDSYISVKPLSNGVTDMGKMLMTYGDVIKWKHFPCHWSFVRGIHRSPVHSPHKGQWRGALVFTLICALNKRLSNQSWGWWFGTPSRSSWRHCNGLEPNHKKAQQSVTTVHYSGKVHHCLTWWRHQMETFSALLAICAGNSQVPGEFPAQRPVTRSLVFSLNCVWINGWVNKLEAGD